MSELGDGDQEFSRDPRTGRPLVGTAESVHLMIERFPSGPPVTDLRNWRAERCLRDDVADRIEAGFTPIDLPAAWDWRHPDRVSPPKEGVALKA